MRRRIPRLGVLLLSAGLLAACGDDAPPSSDGGLDGGLDAGLDGGEDSGVPAYRSECENLSDMGCLLPWPSSRYLVDDASTLTGRRVALPLEAMPTSRRNVPVDPAQFNRFDGFSPATSIMTAFAGAIDTSLLADETRIDESLAADATTVLLDAATGERVAHFAELDAWPVSEADALRRPLYIRPTERLKEGHRYVVAIRGLKLTDGSAVEPTGYFRALRDDAPLPGASDIEGRRAHFEDIFGLLATAGVPRAELIQAWDFETASGPSSVDDLLTMRDAALLAVEADMAAGNARCTVTSVEDAPTAGIFRRVEGTVRTPLFLNGTDPASVEESRIHRGPDGGPTQNGWVEVPFTVNIPSSLSDSIAAGGAAGRLMDYGHGLLGSRGEGNSGWLRDTLAESQMVAVAIDWWGMAEGDLGRVAGALGEFSRLPSVTERLGQGLINHVVLHRSFRSACTSLPELAVPADAGTTPAIDPNQLYYYGNSQGGIMGLPLAGIAVDVERFVIGVGGTNYSLTIPRSSNWKTFEALMKPSYPDPVVRALLMVMSQAQWDLGEGPSFLPHLLADPLPCDPAVCASGLTPAKKILFQIGQHDAQVSNRSAEYAARTMGLPYASPAPYTPWGMSPVSAAQGEVLADSALVIYRIDGTTEIPPGTRDPGPETPAHEGVRREPAARAQLDAFLREGGTLIQTCDGACDPS